MPERHAGETKNSRGISRGRPRSRRKISMICSAIDTKALIKHRLETRFRLVSRNGDVTSFLLESGLNNSKFVRQPASDPAESARPVAPLQSRPETLHRM